MRRRASIAVALAAMLLLAGCSLGGLGGSPATDDESPTATGTPTPSATPAFSAPAGYDEGGVTNISAAIDAHRNTLLASSGFSVSYDAVVNSSEQTTTVRYDQRVETGTEEALRETNVSSGDVAGSVARYYANDTVYVQSRQPGATETSYNNRSKSYSPSSFAGTQLVRPALTDVSYGSSEVVTDGGSRAVVYSDATLDAADSLLGKNVDIENVTAFSATLTVGENGIVRKLTYTATVQSGGDERTVEVTVRTYDVGSTTVDRPDWVSQA